MTNRNLTAKIVREAIEQAFAEVRYPGDDYIVMPSEWIDLERDEIKEAFKGKHWRDALAQPVEFLRYHDSALSFFTPEAYQFFLPAYLITSIENYAQVDVVPDAVVFSINALDRSPESLALCKEKTARLTTTQRKAIKLFLEFLKAQYPDDDPLGRIDKALASL